MLCEVLRIDLFSTETTDNSHQSSEMNKKGNYGITNEGASSDKNETKDSQVDRLRRAAGAYHAIENIGRENSLPDLQTIGFIRRQEMHHRRYRVEGNWGKWIRAATARLTLLYGESPYRVVGFSLFIILLSGMLYPLGGFRTSGSEKTIQATTINEWIHILPDGVYFSTLTFTTLGFGDFQPVSWGKWLAISETALGAMLIALLVFVLSRRAAR
jgi:hypothetical protein